MAKEATDVKAGKDNSEVARVGVGTVLVRIDSPTAIPVKVQHASGVTTDDHGNLVVTEVVDGVRGIRAMFRKDRWLEAHVVHDGE